MLTLHLKQPKGFYIIAFGELCERFSYYGSQTLLVIYLTTQFFLHDDKSYTLYGAYAAFAYALPVLGGVLADRLLGIKQAIIIGGALLVLGNLLMVIPKLDSFYAGLAVTACGIGLYKPSISSLVGKLYSDVHDRKRDNAFTLFYLGMNIGATASPFIYGLVRCWGYQYGYFVSAILLFISWLLFLLKKHQIVHLLDISPSLKEKWLAYGLIIAVISLVNMLFFNPMLLTNFLLIFAVIALISLIITIFKYEKLERNRLLALLILNIFGMCFFAASLQIGSSINLFIERDINRVIFGWHVPTIMFTSFYPFSVIIAAPFINLIWERLASCNKEPTIPTKLGISLLVASLAFICFVFATLNIKQNMDSHLPIVWILLGNLGLGVGEVCLMPVMLSAISRLAPVNIQSTIMGVWYLFIAIGGYLSGLAAKVSSHTEDVVNIPLSSAIYSQAFVKVSLTILLIACLLFALTPWIKSLYQTNKINLM